MVQPGVVACRERPGCAPEPGQRGRGRTGSAHPGCEKERRQIPAQAPHPPQVPKRIEESPGILHAPQRPGFPPSKVAPSPRGGPSRTAALLPPGPSRRDEGPRCSCGARRGHG